MTRLVRSNWTGLFVFQVVKHRLVLSPVFLEYRFHVSERGFRLLIS